MIRTFVILTFALLSFNLLNLGTPVYSVDSTDSSTKKEVKDLKMTKAAEINKSLPSEIKTKKEGLKTLRASGTAELKKMIKAKKEGFESQVKAKREEAKTKIKSKKEEFKTKLQALKDEKKKEIVQRIDTNISEINQKRTDHFTEVLNKVTSLLDKATNRATKAESSGKDITSVRGALTKAETTLNTAKAAVTSQAAKQYVINVTEETKLGQATGSVKQQLINDLKSTHKIVQDAREAVVRVLKSLSQVSGVDEANPERSE